MRYFVSRFIYAVLFLVLCGVGHAADFDVTSADDHNDGTCDIDCTLREAIVAANANAGADNIFLRFLGTVNLGSALPALADSVTVSGNDSTVRRDTGGNYSVFVVNTGVSVTLNNMTISNGGDNTVGGGAVHNSGTLTLNNCTLKNNNAGNGGAIYSDGTLDINNSTFTNNVGVFGGGISNSGTATVQNSTFEGNTTANFGGAIFNDNSLTIINCTFNNNEATLGGGALSDNNGSETFVIKHCTIAGNRSLTAGSGGGIDGFASSSFSITHTILAENTANGVLRNYGSVDTEPAMNSGGYNISDGAPKGLTGTGDLINRSDINLGALADNGGPTLTMALLTGSAAINAGSPSFAPPPSSDQRGLARVNGGRIDIGAIEVDAVQSGPSFVVNNATDNDDGACTEADCSLREAINAANTRPGGDIISIPAADTITLGAALPNITESVTVQGTNSGALTPIDGAGLFRPFAINAGQTVIMSRLRLINGHNATNGGAISNSGTLTLITCVFTNNTSDLHGGAIENGDSLDVLNCTFNGNVAGGYGGAIFNGNTVALSSSTFTDNEANSGGGAMSDNNGNETFVIKHCTIAGNRSLTANSGGGIDCINFSSVTLTHTILANNTANGATLNYEGTGTPPTLVSNGYNLSNDAPPGLTGTGDLINKANINLGALGDNGGETPTMALLGGSAALNAGDVFIASPPTFDQRGAGFPRIRGGNIDIGAFEAALLAVNDVTVAEGNAGTSNATFTVTLSEASPQTVTVNYATSNGTATQPADYTSASGTLTFAPGQTSQTIAVPIKGDTLDEVNETFAITLSNATGAAIFDGSGTGTISDDDAAPSISIANVTVPEGNAGTSNATFIATLSAASGQNVTVNYATSNGAAVAPGDYTNTTGALTFTPGQTSKTFTVPIVGDVLDEANETFTVTLSNATNATIGTSATGTITDDDLPPSIFASDITITEANSAAGTAIFTINLSAPSSQTVTVNAATLDNSAKAGSDYVALPSTTVTFAPGQTSRTVSVTVNGDLVDEADEIFKLRLTGPVNATVADNEANCTILDNDATPQIRVTNASIVEGNSSSVALNIPVTLSSPSSFSVKVDFATADNSAKARVGTTGGDYIARTGTLTFAPGETTKNITVSVIGETIYELNENFFVNLTNPVNGTIGRAQSTGSITNDDLPPTVTISNAQISEGNSGTKRMTFQLLLSSPSEVQCRVQWDTQDVTALAASDYVSVVGGAVLFPLNTRTAQAYVTLRGDRTVEADEQFKVKLSSPLNCTIGTAEALGTIVNDDAAAAAEAWSE